MIYLLKKSKKTNLELRYKLSLDDAKKSLYALNHENFRVNNFYVQGADTVYEMQELLNYFSPNFFTVEQDGMFDMYKVNIVSKYERIVEKGASIKAIEKFKEKIETEIKNSEIELEFPKETFVMKVYYEGNKFNLICNYDLQILETVPVKITTKTFEEIGGLVKKINGIFRKQRYYYKRKGE